DGLYLQEKAEPGGDRETETDYRGEQVNKMEAVLMHLWNISIQAVIIFSVVMAARGVFSLCRVPKRYVCGLWAILFIRLL
ncbi:hypothetical protein DK853_40290, partial [Klebsiella oxytoca]